MTVLQNARPGASPVGDPAITCEPCTDAATWARLADAVPWATPQHAFAYGRTLETCFGYLRARHLVFRRAGVAVAGLPLIRLSAGWPFRAIYSSVFDSYGGPVVRPDHLGDPALHEAVSAALDREARAFGAFEARVAIPPTAPDIVVRSLLRDGSSTRIDRSCPLLRLDRTWSEIERGYRASVRRAIRRSARAGLELDEEVGIDETRAAYPVYCDTMTRIGGTAKPWRLIEALLRAGLAVAFTARRRGRVVGVVILLVRPGLSKYWISAAEASASRDRPTNALVHRAIRWSHERGVPLFSFGESHGERPGLVRFKEGWGTTRAASTVVVRVYRPWVQRAWCGALEPVARWTYARWDRLRRPAT
ncbi:MAG: GNAT family N-acetyltransferase [Planctomycetota bacterium]